MLSGCHPFSLIPQDSLESSTKKSEFSCRKNNLTDWRNAAACNVVLEYLDDSETGCSCEEEEREKFDKEFSLEDVSSNRTKSS